MSQAQACLLGTAERCPGEPEGPVTSMVMRWGRRNGAPAGPYFERAKTGADAIEEDEALGFAVHDLGWRAGLHDRGGTSRPDHLRALAVAVGVTALFYGSAYAVFGYFRPSFVLPMIVFFTSATRWRDRRERQASGATLVWDPFDLPGAIAAARSRQAGDRVRA
jgi:hypothetical protein